VLQTALLATRLGTTAAGFSGHDEFNNSLLGSVCRKRRSPDAQVRSVPRTNPTPEGTCTPTKKWGDYFDARKNQLAWIFQTGCAVRRRNNQELGRMRMSDLIKATLVCGGIAFMVYSYPVISQVAIIGLLCLLWISCAHQTIRRVAQR